MDYRIPRDPEVLALENIYRPKVQEMTKNVVNNTLDDTLSDWMKREFCIYRLALQEYIWMVQNVAFLNVTSEIW